MKRPPKSELAATVDEMLKRKGWNRKILAREIKHGEDALSRTMTGKGRMSPAVAHRIGRALDLGPADYQYLHILAARTHGWAV